MYEKLFFGEPDNILDNLDTKIVLHQVQENSFIQLKNTTTYCSKFFWFFLQVSYKKHKKNDSDCKNVFGVREKMNMMV